MIRKYYKLISSISIFVLLFTVIPVRAVNNEEVTIMANKYCNITGTNHIKDEFEKITLGFDKVELDNNGVKTRIDNHVKGTAEKHKSSDIEYEGAVGGATNLNAAIDYLDTRVDNIITTPAEGVSAQEIIDARGGEITLGGRLDGFSTQMAELATKNELESHRADYTTFKETVLPTQGGSFVDKMIGLMRIRGIYAYVKSPYLKIGIGFNDDLKSVIEYNFLHNEDGLLLLRGVKSGVEDTANVDVCPDATLTGTYISTSAPATYTTTPGDTFTVTFKGYKAIKFKRTMESRGGIWEFDIGNGNRKKVTCYNPTTIYGVETLLFDNLNPRTQYTVTATFLGNDPDHAPSSSPSRGYLYYNSADATARPILPYGIVNPINASTAQDIVAPNSIPDFAISAKPANASYSAVWVPSHAGMSGVSGDISVKLQFDGYDQAIAVGGLPAIVYQQIEDFELTQRFQAYNPNGSDGAMWNHYVNHVLRSSFPCLVIQNSLNVLQDTKIGAAYLGMAPSKQSTMDKLILSNGTEYSPLLTDGSETSFEWDVNSALFVGDYVAGNYHGCAIDVLSLREACNYGKTFQPITPGLITFRTDDVCKVYFRAVEPDSVLTTGEKLTCVQRIACISGVRYPNEYMRSIY